MLVKSKHYDDRTLPEVRPGFQVSAAPRHRSYCRPSVPTITPSPGSPPTLLYEAAKGIAKGSTKVGNLGVIALLKIF